MNKGSKIKRTATIHEHEDGSYTFGHTDHGTGETERKSKLTREQLTKLVRGEQGDKQ